jgi:predicted glycoside hydrolase/deacetylase ChbG (UPF0249 family)
VRYLIFNADDFGASVGVNRGIVECHAHGVVTSASLMVTGRAVHEAAAMSRDCPALAVGLHWDVWGEDERAFDLEDREAVRTEIDRQLEAFHRLLGRFPTHVDSHRHVHRHPGVRPVLEAVVTPLGIPLRDDGQVAFVGGFYAQWQWGVTNLDYVSVPVLQRMVRTEVRASWTEFSCHPGYRSPDYTAVYLAEREAEVRTLTDPRIRDTIDAEGIRLASFADYMATIAPGRGRPASAVGEN